MRAISSLRTHGLLFASALTFCAVGARAADPTPAPAPAASTAAPATAPAAAPAPVATPTPAPALASPPPTPPGEPAPIALAADGTVPPPPPTEEETFPAGWFRIDSDGAGVQLWAGATHMLSDSVGIATDMYVNATGSTSAAAPFLGEFDIGPSFLAGPMVATPMLGVQFDWAAHRAAALVPQFYLTGGPDPIYMELWLQNYAYTVFDKDGDTASYGSTGGGNTLYGRYFIDYKLGKYFGLGPEVEMTLALNSKSKNAKGDSLTSLPVGANFMFSNYAKNNVLYFFIGDETQYTANHAHVAGRLTFVHNM